MHHTDTVRIATNPRKWRRPAPCPACRKSRPLILTLGTIYNLRTRKPVNTIYVRVTGFCLIAASPLINRTGILNRNR